MEPRPIPRSRIRLKHGRQHRYALLSVAVALAAGIVVFAIWRGLNADYADARPYVRRLADMEFLWQCRKGHLFSAPGNLAVVTCKKCQSGAEPIQYFQCESRHRSTATLQLQDAGPNSPFVRGFRFSPANEWLHPDAEAFCPICDLPTRRLAIDPLDHVLAERLSSRESAAEAAHGNAKP